MVSVIAGHFVVAIIHRIVYERAGVERVPRPGVPAWVMGIAERAIFTPIIAFKIPGAAVSMMAWLALKMAASWSRPGLMAEGETPEQRAQRALGAAFVGQISMGFALVGGLICNGEIPITWITKFITGR